MMAVCFMLLVHALTPFVCGVLEDAGSSGSLASPDVTLDLSAPDPSLTNERGSTVGGVVYKSFFPKDAFFSRVVDGEATIWTATGDERCTTAFSSYKPGIYIATIYIWAKGIKSELRHYEKNDGVWKPAEEETLPQNRPLALAELGDVKDGGKNEWRPMGVMMTAHEDAHSCIPQDGGVHTHSKDPSAEHGVVPTSKTEQTLEAKSPKNDDSGVRMNECHGCDAHYGQDEEVDEAMNGSELAQRVSDSSPTISTEMPSQTSPGKESREDDKHEAETGSSESESLTMTLDSPSYIPEYTLDIADDNSKKLHFVKLYGEVDNGFKQKKYVPMYGNNMKTTDGTFTKVVDGSTIIWTAKPHERCGYVSCLSKGRSQPLLNINVCNVDGSCTFKRFKKVGGDWRSITAKEFEQKFAAMKRAR